MIAEALDWLKRYTGVEKITVDGREYVRSDYARVERPSVKTINLSTLQAVVDIIAGPLQNEASLWVHVDGAASVKVWGWLDPTYRTRELFAMATPAIVGKFQFGTWMPQDVFVTEAQAFFKEEKERDDMLRVVGNIRAAQAATLEDDGVTQRVSTAKGVTLSEMSELPNPVTLTPYVTFPEIDQPSRWYILRVTGGGEDRVSLALFEIPDPLRDETAIEEIKTWLIKSLPEGIPVIA